MNVLNKGRCFVLAMMKENRSIFMLVFLKGDVSRVWKSRIG